jgi:hypothetical protein
MSSYEEGYGAQLSTVEIDDPCLDVYQTFNNLKSALKGLGWAILADYLFDTRYEPFRDAVLDDVCRYLQELGFLVHSSATPYTVFFNKGDTKLELLRRYRENRRPIQDDELSNIPVQDLVNSGWLYFDWYLKKTKSGKMVIEPVPVDSIEIFPSPFLGPKCPITSYSQNMKMKANMAKKAVAKMRKQDTDLNRRWVEKHHVSIDELIDRSFVKV